MPTVQLEQVSNFAINNITVKVRDGELFVLLGPTGAGKTTLLNMIAGLIEYEGNIFFDGRLMKRIPPNQRGIGYLFQDLALFPHLDVASNIAFGLRVRKWDKKERKYRVRELLDLMGIEHLSKRYPKNLSGGEKQRVALARALAPSPEVLLLDEPMSSLDLTTSKYLRMELRQLQRELAITTVYVTHNQVEAEEVSDRIGIIYEGRLEQFGPFQEIFFQPASEKVSKFIGEPNILDPESCKRLRSGLAEVKCGDISMVVPLENNRVEKIALLPRDIYVSDRKPPGPDINRFKGVVREIVKTGSVIRLKVRVEKTIFLAETTKELFESMDLYQGKEVWLILKLRRLRTC